MCLLIFFLLLAPYSSFHSIPASSPPQICVASRNLHFHTIITFISIPLLSSLALSFHFLSFTCPNLFTASLPLSICNLNIFYNPRKAGKGYLPSCLTPGRDFKLRQCLSATVPTESKTLQVTWLTGGVIGIKSERAQIREGEISINLH